MGKTRNTGKLATQIQFDNSNNLVIGNSTSSSFNTSGSVNATGGITGSIYGIGNPTSFSASISSNLGIINNFTASNGISSLNSFSASNGNTSLNAATSSYSKLSGGNTFSGTQIISGSTYIQGDFVVYGSSSIQYISASSVSIGTNVVQLNTNQPAVRFAGISVQDSGSAVGVTGSIFWDGCCNKWIYSNPSGVGYSGGMLMSGPRNTGTIGNETGLTCNYIAKSGGGDHLYDSCIWEMSGSVGINTNNPGAKLDIQGGTDGDQIISIGSTGISGIMGSPTNIYINADSDNNSATGQIQFGFNRTGYSGGSSAMTILESGCIGIGTTLPCALLHIADTTTPVIRLNRNTTLVDGNHIGYTEYYGNSTAYGYVGMWVESASTNSGQFRVLTGINGTLNEKMRITSAGIVCFACQICTKSLWFASNTTAQITFGSNDACNPYVVSDSNNNLYLGSNNGYKILVPQDGCDMVFRTSATYANPQTRLTITSAGNVAIGATSNLNNFTIKSSSDTITSGGLSFQSRTAVTNYIAMGLNSSNDFEIQTWTTPSWITRMYIKNDGQICVPSGVKFGSGSSTLNYYEVGTWTPDVIRSSANPTVTYSGTRDGSYVRVGNVVNLWFDFTIATLSGGSGTYYIAGLPFTVSASMAGYSRVVWRDFTAAVPDANTVVSGFVQKTDTYIYPQNDFTGVCFGTKGSTTLQPGRITGFVSYQA